MLAPYRALFGIPGVPRLVLAGFLARVPIGMETLALVLFVEAETGSFGVAGAVTGAFGATLALGAPVQGRLVDRRGQWVLLPLAVGHAVALVAVVVLVASDPGTPALVAGGALAGIVFPPVSPAFRALWPDLAGERLTSAFSLEAIQVDMWFLLGPLLTSAIAAAVSPETAVLCSAALTVVGVALYVTAPAPRRWHGGERPARRGGALRSAPVRLLLAVWLLNGLTFGFLELGLTGFAEEHSAATTAGVLIGAVSFGSVLGGLAYGAREHHRPVERRAGELLVGVAGGFALLLLPTSIAAMAIACAVGGLALAPAAAALYELIERAAPEGLRVEAQAWLGAASASGVAMGISIAGGLVDEVGARAALLGCVVAAAASAGLLVARRARLQPAR